MKDKKEYAELTVPADNRFTGVFRELVRQVITPAGLPEKQVRRLEMAVEEAFMNAVAHAYEPGSPGPVSLFIERDETRVKISIRDLGIPFDASLEPVPSADESAENSAVPRGLQLIRNIADEVQWISLGAEGKELRLIFYIDKDRAGSCVEPLQAQAGPGPEPAEKTYTVRRFRPEDGVGVARCAYDAYGYSYPSPDLYTPRRLVELNESGALISMVAVSDLTREVVGHCSAQRCYQGPTAEIGQAVVKRADRGGAISGQIFKGLEQEAIREGVHCLVSHEVSSHPASQIMTHRAGFKPCALALGAMPASLDFKKMTEKVTQRESCFVSMKLLSSPAPAVVCAPSHHRDMVAGIYESMGKPATFQSSTPLPGPGDLSIYMNRAWNTADIQVKRPGDNSLTDISRCLRDLLEIGKVDVVYLELPLDQGGIDDLCRGAEEKEGFFFTGLGPSSVTGGGESLYLQYLKTNLDMSHLQIATPMGKEIFAYVALEKQRVGK